MKTRIWTCGLLCIMLLITSVAQGATVTLKNDTYTGSSTQLAVFTGLVAKEGFGSVLIPPSYPFKIYKVRLFRRICG